MPKNIGLILIILFFATLSVSAQSTGFDQNKYGCKSFLGRDKQSLCTTNEGHQACVAAVKSGKWEACWYTAKPESQVIRADGEFAKNDLLKRGCKAVGVGVYECNEPADYNICVGYKNYGSVTSCRNTSPNAKPKLTAESAGQKIYLYAYNKAGKPLMRTMNAQGKFSNWQAESWMLGQRTNQNQAPAICSPRPGVLWFLMHDYNSGNSGTRRQVWNNGEVTEAFNTFLVSLNSNPDVVCRQGNRQALFYRGNKGGVVYRRWENDDLQTNSEILGGQISGTPRGVDYGAGKLAVFAQGTDGYIWWNHNDGGKWSGWESTGNMVMSSEAAVISRASGEIELFALGSDNKLYARRFKNGSFSPWFPWGGPVLASAPSVASWGGKRLDVFARDVAGSVVHFWKDDGTPIGVPGTVETLPGSPIDSAIAVVGVDWQ